MDEKPNQIEIIIFREEINYDFPKVGTHRHLKHIQCPILIVAMPTHIRVYPKNEKSKAKKMILMHVKIIT
jgi:hypothetical protein